MGRPRKYRYTWDDVAKLEADHCKSWGAFDGYAGPVVFDRGEVRGAHWEHDRAADRVTVFYAPAASGAPLRATFGLYRQPSPIGGERVYMLAPCCGRRAVSLALLPEGVRCRRCGLITTHSRREDPARRAKRAAERLAVQLGCSPWYAAPTQRPFGMPAAKFLQLAREHEALVQKALALLAPRLAAAEGSVPTSLIAAL